MQVIYYDDEMPYKITKSIFLAGCSLRKGQEELENWRDTALQVLRDKGFDGCIFIPENRNGKLVDGLDHDDLIEWEEKYLNVADVILMWLDRDIENGVFGLTSNIEYGTWASSSKIVFGAPEDAERVNYIQHYNKKYNIPTSITLTETIETALEYIGEGHERVLGERYIPLHIWRLHTFQNWYKSVIETGNRLEECKVLLYNRAIKYPSASVWVIRPSVYIAKEDRFKTNEIVLGRPDTTSICMYKRINDDVEIVLVKEFRSSGTTEDGFIWELPSGGLLTEGPMSHEENAAQEVKEETGFDLDEKKLKFESSRQLAGTMMAHKSHLFSYELDDDELKWFKAQKGISKGLQKEGEKTYIEVVKLSEIKEKLLVDWSNIGQILSIVG